MLLPIKSIVDYFFPPRCVSCYSLSVIENGFCGQCWSKFNFIGKPHCAICCFKLDVSILDGQICGRCAQERPPYEISRSLMKFDENSKPIIHAFKYYDKTNLAKIFAKLICNRYSQEFTDVDLVIPVPMHKLKRLFRMYNHAHLLALEISKIIDKPLHYNVLIKSKWTKSQTFLSRAERQKNLAGSIKLKLKDVIKDKKILLVDDVKTTGVTITKCSTMLKKAGAASIRVVTIAMT